MSLKEENPSLYQIAKQCVLGLGFGMGAKRFHQILRNAMNKVRPLRGWRKGITCFDPGPGRDRMFRMFEELEANGMEITMTDENTTMCLKEPAKLGNVRRIFARHLPKALKIVERPSGRFEIVLNEHRHR